MFADIFLGLLRRAAHEFDRIDQIVDAAGDRRESRVGLDPAEQVVVRAFGFDPARGLHRMHPDGFMQLLPVAAGFDRLHQDVFGSHEGQLESDPVGDHLRPHLKPVGDIDQKRQNHIDAEEGFRQNQPPVSRIVQRTLEPLRRMGVGGVDRQIHHITRQ
ncbi:hypothetical protein SDC9_131647 [bioreactor metagenome]|uniref:Uncharacterized protein n=1 Tax=bioreactor metagenome TaxID=1076179 RepID=A0A645D5I0_9ZZZZ